LPEVWKIAIVSHSLDQLTTAQPIQQQNDILAVQLLNISIQYLKTSLRMQDGAIAPLMHSS
jgi:hypothetical protein